MNHTKMSWILGIVIILNIIVAYLMIRMTIEFKKEIYNKFSSIDKTIYDIDQRLTQWEFTSSGINYEEAE